VRKKKNEEQLDELFIIKKILNVNLATEEKQKGINLFYFL
jgi:hypothetical protein